MSSGFRVLPDSSFPVSRDICLGWTQGRGAGYRGQRARGPARPRFWVGAARGNAVFPVPTGARRTQTAGRASHRPRLRGSCGEEAPRRHALRGAGSPRRQGPGVAGSRWKRWLRTGAVRGAGPRSASLTSSSAAAGLTWPGVEPGRLEALELSTAHTPVALCQAGLSGPGQKMCSRGTRVTQLSVVYADQIRKTSVRLLQHPRDRKVRMFKRAQESGDVHVGVSEIILHFCSKKIK